jgi:type IV pilus secretin PilQ/predicted competence protein
MLVTLLLVLGLCVVSIAQDAEEPAEEEKLLTAVQQKMLTEISVDFRETPIDDVIRTIAKQVDLDIVKGPDVTGNVTATLTNVPLEEALSQILAAYGYGYVPSENMIRIVPAAQLNEETQKLVSKVYRVVYADVTEIEAALTKVISPRGSISSSPSTGNIMVTDTESKMTAIDIYVEEMDRMTAQIQVEARIYDISNSDSLDLGIEWNNIGRNISRTDPFVAAEFTSGVNKADKTTSTLNIGTLNQSLDIDGLMTAEQVRGAAKLLASPRILVLDNQTATFKAVREIPYQQLQQGGWQSFGTTEFKEVGVELEVTPHLAKDGMIRLHIVPVFSVHVSDVDIPLETTAGLGGTIRTAPQPVVDRRSADTMALVQDGDTVVIGGLRKEEVTQEISKIPILGDIPLLGALFRFEGEEIVNSELVVFITPRLIEEPSLTGTEKKYLEATETTSPKPPTTRVDPQTGKMKIIK